jgi:hypothetical protein
LRDQHAISGEIEAPVPLMVRGIANEDINNSGGGGIVGSGGRKVMIAGTPNTRIWVQEGGVTKRAK